MDITLIHAGGGDVFFQNVETSLLDFGFEKICSKTVLLLCLLKIALILNNSKKTNLLQLTL